jgi:hypothetical protein
MCRTSRYLFDKFTVEQISSVCKTHYWPNILSTKMLYCPNALWAKCSIGKMLYQQIAHQQNAPSAKCSITKMLYWQNALSAKCSISKMLH